MFRLSLPWVASSVPEMEAPPGGLGGGITIRHELLQPQACVPRHDQAEPGSMVTATQQCPLLSVGDMPRAKVTLFTCAVIEFSTNPGGGNPPLFYKGETKVGN